MSNLVGRASAPAGSWMLDQLPTHLAEDDFFRRFVAIFQTISDSVQHHVETLPLLGDPAVTPLPMLRYIAGWVSQVGVDPGLDPARQRELVHGFGGLLAWKGTRAGLTGLLELVTGGDVRIVDSGGVYAAGEAPAEPKRVEVDVDSTGEFAVADIVAAVRANVAVDVAIEVRVAGRPVWPAPRTAAEVRADDVDTATLPVLIPPPGPRAELYDQFRADPPDHGVDPPPGPSLEKG